MRKYRFWLSSIALAALILTLLPAVSLAQPSERKIIVFEEGILNEGAREALVKHFGGVEVKNLKSINGKAVLLPPKAASILAKTKGVKRVDDDAVVSALGKVETSGKGAPTPVQPSQKLPWGVDRIDAELVWGTTTGAGIKVAVVDTGIDLAHPDLKTNIKNGYNAINPAKSANDDNGHGTHVAGTIAALNNTIGVVGVGPQINLYAVKVLDRRGSGYLSDVIEGLDWAIVNGIQVVNMSLGTSSDVSSFHEAVTRAKAAGITLVAAAGNDYGGPVNFPAAYSEVIAVSATNSANVIASFSSVGPQVDLAAPGVSIFSTYKGSGYATLSGTSMASPHAAGAAAMLLTQTAKCDTNFDGKCSPDEVQARLEATATELGATGKDGLYGAGLVNVASAVQ